MNIARLLFEVFIVLTVLTSTVYETKAAPLYQEDSPACLAWKNVRLWVNTHTVTKITSPTDPAALDAFVAQRIAWGSFPPGYTSSQMHNDMKAAGYEKWTTDNEDLWKRPIDWKDPCLPPPQAAGEMETNTNPVQPEDGVKLGVVPPDNEYPYVAIFSIVALLSILAVFLGMRRFVYQRN